MLICITARDGAQSCALAAFIAAGMSRISSVLLIDSLSGEGQCHAMLGQACELLNVRDSRECIYNLGDVVQGRCDIDDALCELSQSFLLLPSAAVHEDSLPEDIVAHLAQIEAAGRCDHTIIALGGAHSNGVRTLLERCDRLVIACDADARGMEFGAAYHRFARPIIGQARTRLAITSLGLVPKGVPDLETVIDTVGAQLIGLSSQLPEQFSAEDTGCTEYLAQCERMAHRLLGNLVNLPAAIGAMRVL